MKMLKNQEINLISANLVIENLTENVEKGTKWSNFFVLLLSFDMLSFSYFLHLKALQIYFLAWQLSLISFYQCTVWQKLNFTRITVL